MAVNNMAKVLKENSVYEGPALFSYGFRPFFLCAAIFAGSAIPAWILLLANESALGLHFAPRDWHVHEMVFGFLPAVMTGFLLTAIPNWTDRPPLRGRPLMLLAVLWLGGRLAMVIPWINPLVVATVDAAFFVIVAGIVWREIAAGQVWDRWPIGGLISLYALANILFHILFFRGVAPDLPERMALGLIMILLALIGGRITPSFTLDYLEEQGLTEQPASFSRFDGLSIILVGMAASVWTMEPEAPASGLMLMAAGGVNLLRFLRWYGWMTWREPLVLILHVGYGWLVVSLLILGGSIWGFPLVPAGAVHALTTGAVGVMTLAVMTRASLGHTGRPKQADFLTILIYLLVNLGAILRLVASMAKPSTTTVLGLAAGCWSGAYVLFAVVYGPMLLRRSIDE